MDLAGALVEGGAVVRIVTLGPRPGSEQRVEAMQRRVGLIETGHPPDWMASGRNAVRLAGKAAARLARQFGADVVQLNTPALAADAPFPGRVVAVNHSCIGTWWAAVHGSALPERFAWCATMTGDGLAAADVAIAPTAAFAVVTLEVHALRSLPRTVHNGWDGAALFVDIDDPADLADGLQSLIDDPPRRRSAGSAAQERARTYPVGAMTEGMAAAYAAAMATVHA